MWVGSHALVRDWKVLHLALFRLFNIAIVTPKIALKHQSKAYIAFADGSLLTLSPITPLPIEKKLEALLKLFIPKEIGNTDCSEVDPLLNQFGTFFRNGSKWVPVR